MPSLQDIYTSTAPTYQKPEDQDFPVSKLRFFIDVLWQSITEKPLTDSQRTDLKSLIDLLNSIDEHKHESTAEMIAALMPSIGPLLENMPSLGHTASIVFSHLIPSYQHYLPSVETMVRDAHRFTLEEACHYYESTIFDHLFLTHLFEENSDLNLIEIINAVKIIIFTNALVYDYHQHIQGRSISFFTFLERGGIPHDNLLPFLRQIIQTFVKESQAILKTPKVASATSFIVEKILATTSLQPSTSLPQSPDSNLLPPSNPQDVFSAPLPKLALDSPDELQELSKGTPIPILPDTTPAIDASLPDPSNPTNGI